MHFPFQILIIVAHSLTFACSQLTESTVPFLNNSAIALPLSSGGFTATTSDANNDWYDTAFACIVRGTGTASIRPKIVECTNALFIMYQDDALRTFTSGRAASDIYQLPKSFQSGRCKITISMMPGLTREVTSWHRIGLDATRLVFSCGDSDFARTGGKVRTGGSRFILISVYKLRPQPGQFNEDTKGMMNGSSIM